ncbi:MAG: DUF1501 domain-containing protein, partial [Pirellulaceae bacterium]
MSDGRAEAMVELAGRRRWLQQVGCGFGALAASALAAGSVSATTSLVDSTLAGSEGLHLPPRAKRVIFLFMQGGVSQVDSFDHKPLLAKHHGQTKDFRDARALANTSCAMVNTCELPVLCETQHFVRSRQCKAGAAKGGQNG